MAKKCLPSFKQIIISKDEMDKFQREVLEREKNCKKTVDLIG